MGKNNDGTITNGVLLAAAAKCIVDRSAQWNLDPDAVEQAYQEFSGTTDAIFTIAGQAKDFTGRLGLPFELTADLALATHVVGNELIETLKAAVQSAGSQDTQSEVTDAGVPEYAEPVTA